jgi:hypothetical protein
MNKNDNTSSKKGSKEEVTQIASTVASISASAVLANLDRYMAAAGYDDTHPWRAEIASAAGSGDAALDAVGDIIMCNDMVNGLLVLAIQESHKMEPGSKVQTAIIAARRYVSDVSTAAEFLMGSPV